jgi:hypothetical protein
MTKLNPTVEKKSASVHKNFMNGNSWDINNPFLKLQIMGASSFFGEPKYYDTTGSAIEFKISNGKESNLSSKMQKYMEVNLGEIMIEFCSNNSLQHDIKTVINQCLDTDVEKTLQLAANLRTVDMIRTLPQVILVHAAMHPNCKGTGLIGKYIDKICVRGDEPAAGLAYLISNFGKNTPIPNALKKGWKKVLESFNDYVISKYRMENNFVKTRDVVNLVHAYSESINKLMNGNAKQEKTWNNIVSNANKETKSQKEIWTEALAGMPHMALLRNLRNLYEADVDFNLYSEKLLNGVAGGKQLPFRYYSAYKAFCKSNIKSVKHEDLIAECLEKSFENAPKLPGKVACLSDNSGSAWGTLTSELGTMHVAEIGNMMAVATAKMADEGVVGVFGDKLFTKEIRKTDSMLTQINEVDKLGQKVGGGTENGIWLFFDEAIKNKEHYDHIFVYSDMQCGHGELYGNDGEVAKEYIWEEKSWNSYIDVPKLINTYRKKVNPNVMVYLVQTAGYGDTLVPECFNKTFVLGGWSQNIPMFAAKMYNIFTENKLF